jgi:hypothetical protein
MVLSPVVATGRDDPWASRGSECVTRASALHGTNLWISCVLAVYFAGQRVRKITRQQAHHVRQPEKKKAAPKDGFFERSPS